MPVPQRPCTYCRSLKHWPYQCQRNPSTKKFISKNGKHAKQWAKTRATWFRNNPADGYQCYLCGMWMLPERTTLDHVIPRSRRPDLRYEQSNLKPCCWACNSEKGSRVYE